MRPRGLDPLLSCLERLREANRKWCQAAGLHHDHLLVSKLADAEACLPGLEAILQEIAEAESLRMERTVELADSLGIPSDPPPRLDDLVAALPEDCRQDLTTAGAALREALVGARSLADRIRGVAEVGLKISESVLSMARRAATVSARPPAAYVRGGRRTIGTAVPVFQRAWKG